MNANARTRLTRHDRLQGILRRASTLNATAIVFAAVGILCIAAGVWRYRAPVDDLTVADSTAAVALDNIGRLLRADLARVVRPAMDRTQKIAADPQIAAAIRNGDRQQQTEACNAAIAGSTELDAVALFDHAGRILAINNIYSDGKPIASERIARILRMNFDHRDIVQKCVRNTADERVLEFQATCDITPALFDSTGLSVAYSVPVRDPATGQKIGIVSSRLRFERLTDLVRLRDIGGRSDSIEFVTDQGGYFSEEINGGRAAPPVAPSVLAGIVAPLAAGTADYCFTHSGNDYLLLFRLKDFVTLSGGGIQVMLLADESWLASEARQSRALASTGFIAAGLFGLLLAALIQGIASFRRERQSLQTTERLRHLVDERTAALQQANGQLTAEIAERVRSEQALRESEARARRLLDTALDGVVSFDQEGRIVEFNPTAEACFGLAAAHAVGRSLEEFLPSPEFWTAFRRGLAYFRETGSPLPMKKPIELEARRAAGGTFPVEASLTALSQNGQPQFIAFLRDLTQRQQLQDQLSHAQRLEAIGSLAGGVAHEFNNLLQAIQGYTRFAMEGLAPGDQRYQDLDQSLQVAKRAALLTRELLGFSRREVLVRSYISPNQIVGDVVKTLRPLIREDIEIRATLAEDVGTIHVDARMLQQMLLNLCLNARDAMSEGGDLVIATANVVLDDEYCQAHPDMHPGRYLLLTVSDTGCGMTRETQEHLFEPFYTTKEVGQGTGMGLAMVYGVAQQHGGAIHVYSELGLGTTCRLYLPTVEAPQPEAEPAADKQPQRSRGMETILVAEDEPLVRDLLVRILKSAGYETLTACDGEEAVRAFEANAARIGLALLDVVMPKMGGRAVYQAIRMLNPATKVIFCSGYDPDTNCGGFVAEEGLQLIQKPFHPGTLLKALRQALDAEQPCLAT